MAIVEAVFPLASAALAAILTHIMHMRLAKQDQAWQVSEDFRKASLEKGEELYSLIHDWNGLSTAPLLYYRKVMAGELDYNAALDAVSASQATRMQKFERIDLLISIYFPELKQEFEKVRETVHRSNKIESDFRYKYKQGLFSSEKHKSAYEDTLILAEKQTEDILAALATRLRAIVATE